MSSDNDIAVRLDGIAKCYQIYARPEDRLKQSLFPRFRKLVGLATAPYYREFWALRDVSLEIRRGQTLGIIGRNGSGKSTLLQILCGTLTPTEGTVEIRGRVAALLELGSGFNPEFTGRENVYMSAAVHGLSKDKIDERYADIVRFADIGAFIDQPVKTYSSGMYVRLAFAVIANVDADILVVDEALAVGDAVFTQKCMRFLRDFMQRGTLIFVSHDTASVLNLCDSVLWLDQGQQRMLGTAKSVTDAYLLDCMEISEGQGIEFERIHAKSESAERMVDSMGAHSQASFFDNIALAEGWTTHRARIESVTITDAEGGLHGSYSGGETVELVVSATALADLSSPIIGFLLKDRLGQSLFGKHTFRAGPPLQATSGDTLTARFSFSLPLLLDGDYSVTVSIADGTPEQNIQHHWLHDAVIVKVASTDERHGLVGIPFKHVSLSTAKGIQ